MRWLVVVLFVMLPGCTEPVDPCQERPSDLDPYGVYEQGSAIVVDRVATALGLRYWDHDVSEDGRHRTHSWETDGGRITAKIVDGYLIEVSVQARAADETATALLEEVRHDLDLPGRVQGGAGVARLEAEGVAGNIVTLVNRESLWLTLPAWWDQPGRLLSKEAAIQSAEAGLRCRGEGPGERDASTWDAPRIIHGPSTSWVYMVSLTMQEVDDCWTGGTWQVFVDAVTGAVVRLDEIPSCYHF